MGVWSHCCFHLIHSDDSLIITYIYKASSDYGREISAAPRGLTRGRGAFVTSVWWLPPGPSCLWPSAYAWAVYARAEGIQGWLEMLPCRRRGRGGLWMDVLGWGGGMEALRWTPSPSPGVTCRSSRLWRCDERPGSPRCRPCSDSVVVLQWGPSAQRWGSEEAVPRAGYPRSGLGRRGMLLLQLWRAPPLASPSCGSEGNPETCSPQGPTPESQLVLGAGTERGNAERGGWSCRAGKATVVWKRWKKRRRRPVSGWQIPVRDGKSAAVTAERRAGGEGWIWFYWPPSHRCHEPCH